MRIGIVIPVLNQFEKAVDAISSIKSQYDCEVKIIPNYREDNCLSAAWNAGLRWSRERRHSFTLIINDDILFAPDTIDNMVHSFLKLETGKNCVMITGSNVRNLLSNPYDILSYKTKSKGYEEHPDFACFMVRPIISLNVGFFDENFIPAYFEDNDYHYRINLRGLKAFSDASASYFHYGSQTQNASQSSPVVPPMCFEINRAYYIEKWGGNPGNEVFSNPYNDPEYTFQSWRPVSSEPILISDSSLLNNLLQIPM